MIGAVMSRKSSVATVVALYSAVVAQAQPERIAESIDTGQPVKIAGHLRKITNLQVDEGLLDPSFQLDGLMLFLKPSRVQQTALNQLLRDLQDPHSPNYHQWLTPEEYASRFGLSALDVAKIADWLRAEGFAVNQVARGRSWI